MDKRISDPRWKVAIEGVEAFLHGPIAKRGDVIGVVRADAGKKAINYTIGTFLLTNGSYLHVRYWCSDDQLRVGRGVRISAIGGSAAKAEAAFLQSPTLPAWKHLLGQGPA